VFAVLEMLLNSRAQAHAELAPDVVWELAPDLFATHFRHHTFIFFVIGWDRFANSDAMPIQDWSFKAKALR
jgi:hypothetical protein